MNVKATCQGTDTGYTAVAVTDSGSVYIAHGKTGVGWTRWLFLGPAGIEAVPLTERELPTSVARALNEAHGRAAHEAIVGAGKTYPRHNDLDAWCRCQTCQELQASDQERKRQKAAGWVGILKAEQDKRSKK